MHRRDAIKAAAGFAVAPLAASAAPSNPSIVRGKGHGFVYCPPLKIPQRIHPPKAWVKAVDARLKEVAKGKLTEGTFTAAAIHAIQHNTISLILSVDDIPFKNKDGDTVFVLGQSYINVYEDNKLSDIVGEVEWRFGMMHYEVLQQLGENLVDPDMTLLVPYGGGLFSAQ
jgi:hypothetical protein